MLHVIQNTALEAPRTVSATVNSAAVDVSKGCDSLTIVAVISGASSPSGASAQLAGSLDGITYIPIGSSTAISANGNISFTQDRPPYVKYRIQYVISTGSFVSTTVVVLKGDR